MPQFEMLEGSMMSARMAMAISDPHQPDNPIVFANPAFMEMTGYDSGDVIGRNCRFLQGPDTNPSQLAILRCALDERRAVEIDLLNYRRSGEAFHNRLFVSPVLDHHGELVHFFASQLDVTPQKRFESLTRRREDVLRAVGNEFHARVQTTIDNVQSMVEGALQSASSPMAAAADISEKLVALGHVHRSLIKSDWDNLDIRDVIASALRSASQTSNRMQLSGPVLKLSPRLAFQVAAFVRDLFIQSLSEGALQGTQGMSRFTGPETRGRIPKIWSSSGGTTSRSGSRACARNAPSRASCAMVVRQRRSSTGPRKAACATPGPSGWIRTTAMSREVGRESGHPASQNGDPMIVCDMGDSVSSARPTSRRR